MYRSKKGPNVWVVRRSNRFSIKEEGQPGYIIPPVSQQLAINIGRQIARENGSELIIQNREARIRARDSHGADRFPPRG